MIRPPTPAAEAAGTIRPHSHATADRRPPRFARTMAAASDARSWAMAEGDDAPWHLCQRREAESRKAGRWWNRLLKPLIPNGKPPASDAGRWPVAAAAGGAPMLAKPAPLAPVERARTATSASGEPAARSWFAVRARTDAPDLPWPASPGRSGIQELAKELPARAFEAGSGAEVGHETPGPAGIGALATGLRAGAEPDHRPAEPKAGRDVTGLDPSPPPPWWSRPGEPDRPGGDPASATTSASGHRTDSTAGQPLVPIEPHASSLAAGPPSASRLADALAGRLAAEAEDRDAPTSTPSRPRSGARERPTRRTMARTFTVAGALAASLVLGFYVQSGVTPTWGDLGRSLLALYGRAFEGPVDRGTATQAQPVVGPRADDGGIDGLPGQARSESANAGPPAAEADASPWEVLYARGHRLQLQGNLVAAGEAYRQALRLNPQQVAVLYDLGYVLQLQGNTDAAIDYYRRAIARQPRHAFAHYNLGTLLQAKGDPEAAIGHYRTAAALEPENPYIYYDWGRSLEAISDPAGAAALYRKVIALDPDQRPGLDARRRLAALATQREPNAPGRNHT